MDGNHVFYDTFEGSGSPSECVWKPFVPIWLEIACFCTLRGPLLAHIIKKQRVSRHFWSPFVCSYAWKSNVLPLWGPRLSNINENHVLHDTFEASGTSSGRVWKPFFLEACKYNALAHAWKQLLTHMQENHMFHITFKTSGSPSEHVWKVVVGCIHGKHVFRHKSRAMFTVYAWTPHVLWHFWGLW